MIMTRAIAASRLAALIYVVIASVSYSPARAAPISASARPLSLSDDGYAGIITFIPLTDDSPVRTTYLYRTDIAAADRCGLFYAIAFLLTDDDIKGFADIAVSKLASKLQLTRPSGEKSDHYNRKVRDLENSLERGDRNNQWIGMSAMLRHEGKFPSSQSAPHSLVPDTDGLDCYFDVQLQYFIMLDAPALIHIIVLDTTPRCGSSQLNDGNFPLKRIDRTKLGSWIDGFGMKHEYQAALDELLKQAQDTLRRDHDSHKALVDSCNSSLKDNTGGKAP